MPEPTQIAVAREKRYETDVRSDSDYDELPTKVRFVLSEADAQEIVRLSALVAANGLHKVEKFDCRASWLEGDDPDAFIEARLEADALNVSENDFWFSGYLKHADVEVLSERQRVSELKEWLGIQEGFFLPDLEGRLHNAGICALERRLEGLDGFAPFDLRLNAPDLYGHLTSNLNRGAEFHGFDFDRSEYLE